MPAPWPGSSGGATRDGWGQSIRLFVQAAIGSGSSLHMGPAPNDRLDSGNVMGPVGTSGQLQVDLACDLVSCEVIDGATKQAGIFSKDEAPTLTLSLYDPTRKYDPTNSASPFWYRGRSRLGAGNPVVVWAEVLNAAGTGVVRFDLFRGVTDRWVTQVEREPADRRTNVTASGPIKWMAGQDYAELASPVGAGDTTAQRLARLVAYFNWAGPLQQVGVASPVTLQGSTMAQSFWELLGRCIDDELGYLHVLPDSAGTIRWWSRNFWTTAPAAPSVTIGCAPGVTAYDVAVDTSLGGTDDQLRNAVYATRTGGTQQVVKSSTSIAAHGGYESTVNRTDLGLADDTQVNVWAQQIVMMFGSPVASFDTVTLLPNVRNASTSALWRALLGLAFVSDTVRVVWAPAGTGPVDQLLRVIGAKHTISPTSWVVTWQTLAARIGGVANVFHMGPHALDKVDAGNVMGAVH